MSLREMLSDYWYAFQQELFPRLESELGPMGERYELFVAVLELVRVEALLPYFRGQVGRPEEDRAAQGPHHQFYFFCSVDTSRTFNLS